MHMPRFKKRSWERPTEQVDDVVDSIGYLIQGNSYKSSSHM